MNYITHLTEVSRLFYKDKRLKPTHISLYHAIFQMANAVGFPKDLYLSRKELMKLSKIKSTVTYYKCLKQMKAWNYISYRASKSPLEASRINIILLDKASKEHNQLPNQNLINKESKNDSAVREPNQKLINKESKNDSVVIPYTNIYSIYINDNILYNKLKNEILLNIQIFFKENFKKKYKDVFSETDLELEAENFFLYFESKDWKRAKDIPINDFRPVATMWMLNAKKFKAQNKRNFVRKNDLGVVHTKREKNYSEPL